MKEIIRNTLLLFYAAIILITASGYTVFRHTCDLERTTEFSILIPDFNCNQYGHNQGWHHSSCCNTTGTDRAVNYGKDKCCDTDTYALELTTTINIQVINNFLSELVSVLPGENEDHICSIHPDLPLIRIIADHPPPLSGKALHIFLHQLKVPEFSV